MSLNKVEVGFVAPPLLPLPSPPERKLFDPPSGAKLFGPPPPDPVLPRLDPLEETQDLATFRLTPPSPSPDWKPVLPPPSPDSAPPPPPLITSSLTIFLILHLATTSLPHRSILGADGRVVAPLVLGVKASGAAATGLPVLPVVVGLVWCSDVLPALTTGALSWSRPSGPPPDLGDVGPDVAVGDRPTGPSVVRPAASVWYGCTPQVRCRRPTNNLCLATDI